MDRFHAAVRDPRRHRDRTPRSRVAGAASPRRVAPWHTAAAGEFWAITVGDLTLVARSDGETFHVVQDSAPHSIAANAAHITAAERIWPRDARKAQ